VVPTLSSASAYPHRSRAQHVYTTINGAVNKPSQSFRYHASQRSDSGTGRFFLDTGYRTAFGLVEARRDCPTQQELFGRQCRVIDTIITLISSALSKGPVPRHLLRRLLVQRHFLRIPRSLRFDHWTTLELVPIRIRVHLLVVL